MAPTDRHDVHLALIDRERRKRNHSAALTFRQGGGLSENSVVPANPLLMKKGRHTGIMRRTIDEKPSLLAKDGVEPG